MMSVLPVIASDSEAIQGDKQVLDCFVAEPVIGLAERRDPLAPRNDEQSALAHHLEKKEQGPSPALKIVSTLFPRKI
jgi:hypothetical protein